MKNTIKTTLAALLALTVMGARTLQDNPIEIAKKDLPKTATCVVCKANGEGRKEEKPAAGVRYKGQTFYFCNVKEVAEFSKDPDAFLPPVLPRPAPVIALEEVLGLAAVVDQALVGRRERVDLRVSAVAQGHVPADRLVVSERHRAQVGAELPSGVRGHQDRPGREVALGGVLGADVNLEALLYLRVGSPSLHPVQARKVKLVRGGVHRGRGCRQCAESDHRRGPGNEGNSAQHVNPVPPCGLGKVER